MFRNPLIDLHAAERNRRRLHTLRLAEIEGLNQDARRKRRSRERKAAKEAQATR